MRQVDDNPRTERSPRLESRVLQAQSWNELRDALAGETELGYRDGSSVSREILNDAIVQFARNGYSHFAFPNADGIQSKIGHLMRGENGRREAIRSFGSPEKIRSEYTRKKLAYDSRYGGLAGFVRTLVSKEKAAEEASRVAELKREYLLCSDTDERYLLWKNDLARRTGQQVRAQTEASARVLYVTDLSLELAQAVNEEKANMLKPSLFSRLSGFLKRRSSSVAAVPSGEGVAPGVPEHRERVDVRSEVPPVTHGGPAHVSSHERMREREIACARKELESILAKPQVEFWRSLRYSTYERARELDSSVTDWAIRVSLLTRIINGSTVLTPHGKVLSRWIDEVRQSALPYE